MRSETFAQCARQFRAIVAVDVQLLTFVDFATRRRVFWRRSRSWSNLRDSFTSFLSERKLSLCFWGWTYSFSCFWKVSINCSMRRFRVSPWIPCMSRTASFLQQGHLILCRSARAFRMTIAESLPLFLEIRVYLYCQKYSGRIFGINYGRKVA